MQEKSPRRSNRERTDATRAALTAAARQLFVDNGYAETGTPAIVAAARVTRGALYHHFEDKADLLRSVVTAEAQAVADAIVAETAAPDTPLEALRTGADAYFTAMTVPGRTRLLLLEGPAVLGPGIMAEIDRATGGGTLRDGLAAALPPEHRTTMPLDALADLLSAAFDRAALAISLGKPADDYRRAVGTLLSSITEPADQSR